MHNVDNIRISGSWVYVDLIFHSILVVKSVGARARTLQTKTSKAPFAYSQSPKLGHG